MLTSQREFEDRHITKIDGRSEISLAGAWVRLKIDSLPLTRHNAVVFERLVLFECLLAIKLAAIHQGECKKNKLYLVYSDNLFLGTGE